MNDATVIAALRAAADRLAGDLAAWAKREPGEPLKFLPGVLTARQAIDETIEQLRRLRRELAGRHRTCAARAA